MMNTRLQSRLKTAMLLLGLLAMALFTLMLGGCQTAGFTTATKTQPAHLRLPVDADLVDATVTEHSCRLHIVGLRSSPAILAQGKSAQGVIGTTGAAVAASGIVGVIK